MNQKSKELFKKGIIFCLCVFNLPGLLIGLSNSVASETSNILIEDDTISLSTQEKFSFLSEVFFLEKSQNSVVADPIFPKTFLGSDIISYLPVVDQAQTRLLSRKYRDYTDLTFFGSVYDPTFNIQAFSSEISSGTIGSNILNILSAAQHRIIIASDKCTNEEFLEDLLTLRSSMEIPFEIRIVTGEDDRTQEILSKSKYSGIFYHHIQKKTDGSGKMHNKFIIMDDRIVITGSPNLTYAAYNYNVESFISINHRFITNIYIQYYKYIISGGDVFDQTHEEYKKVRKLMSIFNNIPNTPIQVCLAPILDIKDFIISELNSNHLININMFLVSRASIEEGDIVDTLLNAIAEGAHVTIKVDKNQYDNTRYMEKALQPIKAAGQAIYTVSKTPQSWTTRTSLIRKTKPQFHDKLILIQQVDGLKKVFIGSAGFTDNVQDNLNLENMILLKVDYIYDFLTDHFTAVNNSRGNLNVVPL